MTKLITGLFFCSCAMATTYQPGASPFTASSRNDGGSFATFGGHANSAIFLSADGGIRWNGNHSNFDVTFFDNSGNAQYCLYQDGVLFGTCATAAGSGSGFTTTSGQWTGASGTHLYEMVPINTFQNAGQNALAEIILTGGTGLGSQPAVRKGVGACGDSITVYVSSGITDARQGDFWQATRATGPTAWDQRYGATGAPVTGVLGPVCPGQMTLPGGSLNLVWLNGGANDFVTMVEPIGLPGPGCTTGTFQCDYYNMIGGTWTANATATVVLARGILPNSYGTYPASNPQTAVGNGYIQNVVSSWNTNNPSKPCVYINPDTWFSYATGPQMSDHLHPTVAAYAMVANREIPIEYGYLNGSSYTVTGPSTGTVGVASTFTLTIQGGATGTGMEVITPSDSGNGGVFTPSSVTIANGFTSATFTYSAASSGAKTISVTNNQTGWTNPANLTFTASSGTVGQSIVLSGSAQSSALTDPNTANNQDWRVEAQLHDYTAPAGEVYIASLNGIGFDFQSETSGNIRLTDKRDATTQCEFSMAGYTNALIRLQRFHATPLGTLGIGQYTCEIWNWDGTMYQQILHEITALNSWGAADGKIGDSGNTSGTADLGFLRIFLTTVAIGGRPPTTADGSPYTEWKFNGDTTDSSGNGHDITMSSPSFVTTPNRVAVSHPQSYATPWWTQYLPCRSGTPCVLEGATSYSLADASSAVSYLWQCRCATTDVPPVFIVPGGERTSQPPVIFPRFGQTTMQLTVTDVNDTTSAATFDYGSISTDSNNAVVTSNETASNVLFGSFVKFGSSQFPYNDWGHRRSSETYGAQYGCPHQFCPDWNIAATGTATMSYGGNTATGTGTAFKAAFCAGGTTGSNVNYFVIWYPDPTIPGRIGRNYFDVTACADDTHITLAENYTGPGGTLNCGAGCNYAISLAGRLGGAVAGSGGWNYYDAGLAHYNLWLRTGLNKYRDFARQILDIMYTHPAIDQGQHGLAVSPKTVPDGVSWARIALDPPSDPSPYLLWARNWCTLTGARFGNGGILGDPREEGYADLYCAYSAAMDPDTSPSGYRDQGKQVLRDAYTNMWAGSIQTAGEMLEPGYGHCGLATPSDNCDNSGGLVMNLVHGTAAVTLHSQGSQTSIPSTYCGFLTTDTGTISVTANSNVITGSGTSFSGSIIGHLPVVNVFGLRGGVYYKEVMIVSSIDSATLIHTVDTWHGDTGSGLSYQLLSSGPWPGGGIPEFSIMEFQLTNSTGAVQDGLYSAGTLTLTNGSTAVVGSGTSWQAYQANAGSFFRVGATVIPIAAFVDSTHLTLASPYSGSTASGVAYILNAKVTDANGYQCTVTSPTTLTLDMPWQGLSGFYTAIGQNNVDFGIQPFFEGILGTAFHAGQVAMSGSDAANQESLLAATAAWAATVGFDNNDRSDDTYALYYGRVFPNCEPIFTKLYGCGSLYSDGAQDYAAEIAQTAGSLYAVSPTTPNQTLNDHIYGSIFSNPKFGATPFTGPEFSITDSEIQCNEPPGGCSFPKFLGFLHGVTGAAAWPAMRNGLAGQTNFGVQNAAPITANIGFSLPAGATHISIEVVTPANVSTSTTCTTSPCAVSVDSRQGDHTYQITYLSGGGATIAKSRFENLVISN